MYFLFTVDKTNFSFYKIFFWLFTTYTCDYLFISANLKVLQLLLLNCLRFETKKHKGIHCHSGVACIKPYACIPLPGRNVAAYHQ